MTSEIAQASGPASPAVTLAGSTPVLFDAIESFIRQNANFESSIVQNRVIEEIGAATDIMQAFAIPMQNTLLTMDGALRWVMFLRSAVDRNEEKDVLRLDAFSADAAIRLISQVYDVGFRDAVLEHFESDSDDEGDEGDEDETDLEGGDSWPGPESGLVAAEQGETVEITDPSAAEDAALDAALDAAYDEVTAPEL